MDCQSCSYLQHGMVSWPIRKANGIDYGTRPTRQEFSPCIFFDTRINDRSPTLVLYILLFSMRIRDRPQFAWTFCGVIWSRTCNRWKGRGCESSRKVGWQKLGYQIFFGFVTEGVTPSSRVSPCDELQRFVESR